jgi:hypothetical protein
MVRVCRNLAAVHDICPYTDEIFEAGIGMEHPMHIKGQKHAVAVRFGTEKSVGFPVLMGIFDSAVTRDSNTRCSSGWGVLPRITVELAAC